MNEGLIDEILYTEDDVKGTPEQAPVRFQKSSQVRSVFKKMHDDDEAASRDRSKVQRMVEGEPPYLREMQKRTGRSNDCNLNFLDGTAIHEKAMSAYVDMATSPEWLVDIPVKTEDPEANIRLTQIVSREYSKALRSEEGFLFNFLLLCHHFVSSGVGFSFFPSKRDWRWKSVGLGDAQVPRKTRATEESVNIIAIKQGYSPSRLMEIVGRGESSEAAGWNLDAIKRAVADAARKAGQYTNYRDHEEIARAVRSNDMQMDTIIGEIELIHLFCRELDGKVSSVIATRDEIVSDMAGEDELLYRDDRCYNNMSEALTVFAFGIGTNGDIHSIRGLGWKIFPHVMELNRMWSRLMDVTKAAGGLTVKARTGADMLKAQVVYRGPLTIISEGLDEVNRTDPRIAQSIMPVITQVSSHMRSNVGQYSPSMAFGDTHEKTRYEVMAHLEDASRLSITSIALFYQPLDRNMREQFRRVREMKPGYPGWEAIKPFFDALERQGIPREVLDMVDLNEVKAVRAIGAGSETQRRSALQELLEMYPRYDPIGQQNILRDITALLAGGYENATRYVQPVYAEKREPIDHKIAVLENSALLSGEWIEPQPGEIDIVHLRAHVERLTQEIDRVQQGEVDVADAAEQLQLLHEHTVMTVERMRNDPGQQADVNAALQAISQIGEIMLNGIRKRRAQMAEQEAFGPGEGGASPEESQRAIQLEQKMMEVQAKIQIARERNENQLNIQIMRQQHEREMQRMKFINQVPSRRAMGVQ